MENRKVTRLFRSTNAAYILSSVTVTLAAGVFVTVCIFITIVAVLIASKYHQSAAVAMSASGCHDDDMTSRRAHRQEMRLSTSNETVKVDQPSACFQPARGGGFLQLLRKTIFRTFNRTKNSSFARVSAPPTVQLHCDAKHQGLVLHFQITPTNLSKYQ